MAFEYQLPMFTPPSAWRPPQINQLPSWAEAKRIAIDLETHDPKLKALGPGVRRGARIVGISFAIEDGPSAYLPIGHPEDNCPRDQVMAYLKDQFKVFAGDIVGANLMYDLDFLWEAGVQMPQVQRFRDVQVADVLINELHEKYNLDAISKRLGLPGKDESLLRDAASAYGVDAKKGLWQLPGRFVGPYAIQDVLLPLQVLRRQEREIEAQDLEQIYELETKLTPVLTRMRRRGVLIDQKKLQEIEDWSFVEQRKALDKLYELSGCRLALEDVNKPKALLPALNQIANIKFGQTAKGQPQIDKDFLAQLKHPIADAVLRARKVDKVRGTFCNSIREHMVNGRIHCTFNQLRKTSDSADEDDKGARYGRLSCVDPNLQQQPARDPEIGPMWRSIYIPEPGTLWAAKDYSQQEPRLTIHYAVKSGCSGAEEYAHKFRTDLEADSHTEMTKLCWGEEITKAPTFKKMRSYAKEIFLGVTYGMGGAKLCRKLGKPTQWKFSERHQKMLEFAGPEGQAIMDEVDHRMPFLRQLARTCERRAKEKGQIRTLLGRLCHFPLKLDKSGYDWCHKALNRLIQGSAADQTKLAVVTMDEVGYTPQLQVHDEVDSSVESPEQAEKMADIMRNCVQLEVPSKVDVELGKSWGDSM